jgi:hypothetical protein
MKTSALVDREEVYPSVRPPLPFSEITPSLAIMSLPSCRAKMWGQVGARLPTVTTTNERARRVLARRA